MTCIDISYTKMILWPSRASWWWSQTSFAGDANTRHAGVFLTTILSPTDYWKCFSFPTVTQFTNYINSLHKWSTNTFRAFPKIYHKSIWASDHAWHNFLTCLHYLGQFLHKKTFASRQGVLQYFDISCSFLTWWSSAVEEKVLTW